MCTLIRALLVLCLNCWASHSHGAQQVDVHFSSDAASGQDIINAQTAFESHGAAVRQVLMAIGGYAELHPWISEVTLQCHDADGSAEFLIKFKFPWPVSRRWSHIEITRKSHGTVSWQQIDGNIKANQGELKFTTRGRKVVVSYQAIVNIGLPDILLRNYKKQFVIEFISAAYNRAVEMDPASVTLAISSFLD